VLLLWWWWWRQRTNRRYPSKCEIADRKPARFPRRITYANGRTKTRRVGEANRRLWPDRTRDRGEFRWIRVSRTEREEYAGRWGGVKQRVCQRLIGGGGNGNMRARAGMACVCVDVARRAPSSGFTAGGGLASECWRIISRSGRRSTDTVGCDDGRGDRRIYEIRDIPSKRVVAVINNKRAHGRRSTATNRGTVTTTTTTTDERAFAVISGRG